MYRVFIKYCVFSLIFWNFSELCQFCCSPGVLPAWRVYTHTDTEKGKSPEYFKIFKKKKPQYLINTLYVNVYGSWEWTEVEFKRPNFDFPGMDSIFNLTVKSGDYSFWRLDSTSALYCWLTRLLPCSWCRGTLRRTWWAWASTISSTPLPRRSSFLPWVTLANGD